MLQVTRIALVAFAIMTVSMDVCAFPPPYPASIDIFPWAPTPDRHTFLSVNDNSDSFYRDVGTTLVAVQATRAGAAITVTAILAEDPTTRVDGIKFQVDLGMLPLGSYTVDYSSSSTHRTLKFTVTTQGYTSAIEYFSSSLGHYFITTQADEIAALDNGTIRGWARTGESFHVIPSELPLATLSPVCRFYGLPQAGLDSHFFTASSQECTQVQQRYPGKWILETLSAFQAVPPTDISFGACPQGSIPIYRLYNNRADANHRYTTSTTIRDQMTAAGWLLEGGGYGALVPTMCAGE
jgi:hypothetical protein